jgi:hypothetical protein
MTITTETRQAGPYLGDGVASAFPFAFKVFAAADLLVVHADVSATESTLVLGVDYSVALNGDQNSNPGGTVTLLAGALASGERITLTSRVAATQPSDITNEAGAALTSPSASHRASQVLGSGALGDVAVYAPTLELATAEDITYLPAGAGAVTRTVRAKLRDTVSVKDFGAVGDASTDDTLAIQAAIDAVADAGGGSVYVPAGTYMVYSRDYVNSAETTVGRHCIMLRNNVTLFGDGWASVIKLASYQYNSATYFRLISSDDVNFLVQSEMRDITIDGSASAQEAAIDCSNILLDCERNVRMIRVNSLESNGNGIMLRGVFGGAPMVDITIDGCTSTGHRMIGLQCAQFRGLRIVNNYVSGTGNNGIDIFGDTGVGGIGTDGNGLNFVIANNTVRSSPVAGIFPETVSQGAITGNSIIDCATGIVCNSIYANGGKLAISGNTITGGAIGVSVFSIAKGVSITENIIAGQSDYAINLDDCIYCYVARNTIIPKSSITALLKISGTNISAYNIVRDNAVINYESVPLASFVVNTATSPAASTNFVGGWHTSPSQQGPDYVLRQPKIVQAEMSYARYDGNGPWVFDLPDNTGGRVTITARSVVTGNFQMITKPYTKKSGTLILGTETENLATGSPDCILVISVVSNQVVVNFSNSGNGAFAGLSFTPFAP